MEFWPLNKLNFIENLVFFLSTNSHDQTISFGFFSPNVFSLKTFHSPNQINPHAQKLTTDCILWVINFYGKQLHVLPSISAVIYFDVDF